MNERTYEWTKPTENVYAGVCMFCTSLGIVCIVPCVQCAGSSSYTGCHNACECEMIEWNVTWCRIFACLDHAQHRHKHIHTNEKYVFIALHIHILCLFLIQMNSSSFHRSSFIVDRHGRTYTAGGQQVYVCNSHIVFHQNFGITEIDE